MKIKNITIASGLLIALHALTMMVSCGSLSKKKSQIHNTTHSEVTSKEINKESSVRQASDWQKMWAEQSNYSLAFLQSDSAIIYHPNGGFQLNKGTLLIGTASKQISSTEGEISSQQEETVEKGKNIKDLIHMQNDAIYGKKERSQNYVLIITASITLIILLLWTKHKYR